MKIIKVKDKSELSVLTGEMLIGLMLSKSTRYNLSITAGSTPAMTYKYMASQIRQSHAFDHVHYFNFDEIPSTDPNFIGITMRDLKKLYFDPAEISTKRIHHLDSSNYQVHDRKLAQVGGLDAMLLGIGKDGHYCGNLPGATNFEDQTVKVSAKGDLRKRICGHFSNSKLVPDHWITMGPRSVMATRKLILIATGIEKAEAIWHLVAGPVDKTYPASILKLHPDLTVIVDQEAATKI
ncbi:glucosamine-6-phosphate deaminase [Lactobacillus melliventris]|uniref:Putative glucosamine-6-phosphate deaminase n=1 Tax=Lactobacillus melliventris TaxID=1218507 RepID=A0A0F4LLN2_9LACO|nr:glucosamine-6-phosphate deaminase [Lactobacillus melliventris]KJY58456.1 putative glucosamine-6-phosphate deaminase [Lactobacillus melliventris]